MSNTDFSGQSANPPIGHTVVPLGTSKFWGDTWGIQDPQGQFVPHPASNPTDPKPLYFLSPADAHNYIQDKLSGNKPPPGVSWDQPKGASPESPHWPTEAEPAQAEPITEESLAPPKSSLPNPEQQAHDAITEFLASIAPNYKKGFTTDDLKPADSAKYDTLINEWFSAKAATANPIWAPKPEDVGPLQNHNDWLVNYLRSEPNLTSAELQALSAHRGSSAGLNDSLRNGDLSSLHFNDQLRVQILDSLLSTSAAPNDLTVFHGTTRDLAGAIRKLPAGSIWSTPAYVSTSPGPDVAKRFGNHVLQITVPKGTPAFALGQHSLSDENEVLLPRGSRFQVLDPLANPPRLELLHPGNPLGSSPTGGLHPIGLIPVEGISNELHPYDADEEPKP